ncbi:MAG TPA: nucleotidyltransferase family protein [Bacteroidales bacterium]|nr:nucleotidyltransferase family protein [Bacteroidales bacterium]
MKAMIFAAGKGTRLGKITEKLPKALVDVNGKTALRLAVEKCAGHGFDDVIVNIHHHADLMEEEIRKLNNEGFRVAISDERDGLLETGGGLFRAKDYFDDKPFLVYNVDIISDIDLTALYNYHIEKKGLATLAVRERKGNRFFLTDQEGRLCGWRNKATGEEILIFNPGEGLSEIAFSGFHIIDPDIFNYMTPGVYTMTTLYLSLAKHHRIYTFRYDAGYWGEIGTPESLENARLISKLPE